MKQNTVRKQNLSRLITLAKHGNRSSLNAICQRLLPFVANLCKANYPDCLQSKVGESDLIQESMLGVSENFGSLHGTGETELLAWVQVIVENKALDFRRRFLQADKRDITRERTLSQARSSQIDRQLQDSTATPLDKLISAEQTETIQKLVEALPHHYREIVELRHRDQLTFPQIAAHMGRTEPAVKNIYVRVIAILEREAKRGCK